MPHLVESVITEEHNKGCIHARIRMHTGMAKCVVAFGAMPATDDELSLVSEEAEELFKRDRVRHIIVV